MSSNSLIPIALRGFQALFAIVVHGLSITLMRGHKTSSIPATLVFTATVGGLSFVSAILSTVAVFKDFLNDQISGVIDGAILLLNIAGGMLMAIKVKGASCKSFNDDYENFKDMLHNSIICGGIDKTHDFPYSCHYFARGLLETLEHRCRESTADSTFMFLTAVVLVAVGTWTYLRTRRRY